MVYESLYIFDIETALCVTLDNPDLSFLGLEVDL